MNVKQSNKVDAQNTRTIDIKYLKSRNVAETNSLITANSSRQITTDR